MKLGQEIYLKPGVTGYGYYQPLATGEKFRLRQSLWNVASWYYLGVLTDTASPDLQNSQFSYIEYQDGEGNYKYISLSDKAVLQGLEFSETEASEGQPEIEFDVTVIKDMPKTTVKVPKWKTHLTEIIAGVCVLGLIVYYAVRDKKVKGKDLKK